MSVQARFRTFDEAIKLKRFEENATLREKRDRVLTRLRSGLAAQGVRITVEPLNQGGDEMGTGIRPLPGRAYDIDVGVVFNLSTHDHRPDVVKGWVYEAVRDHSAEVRWKEPCITVTYAGDFHVNLPVYAQRKNIHGQPMGLALARGKQHSSFDRKFWEPADPKGLAAWVSSRHGGESALQFRRCLRAIKRWKDVNFSSEGHAAPMGIGLTIAAGSWSVPNHRGDDDLGVLLDFVERLKAQFTTSWLGGRTYQSVQVKLPVVPHDDVFARMTPEQGTQLYGKLGQLEVALREAKRLESYNAGEAARILAGVIGPDFPTR
jgi:hypothetical protein